MLAFVAPADHEEFSASQWALRCGYRFLLVLTSDWMKCCPVGAGQTGYVRWCTIRCAMACWICSASAFPVENNS